MKPSRSPDDCCTIEPREEEELFISPTHGMCFSLFDMSHKWLLTHAQLKPVTLTVWRDQPPLWSIKMIITHSSEHLTGKGVLFCSRSESVDPHASITNSLVHFPLSKYLHMKTVAWKHPTGGGTCYAPISPFSSQRKSELFRETQLQKSHSPLNLSLDSLIVSYSSPVRGIVVLIKKEKKSLTSCFINGFLPFIS